MNKALMFSTGKDDWGTPPEIFDPLNDEFGFGLDAAANSANTKCSVWLGPDSEHPDAIGVDWHLASGGAAVWVNPPYSRGLQAAFIDKASREALRGGGVVVMLLPARTDTRVFHACIWDRRFHRPHPGVEVRLLKGRIRFVGAPASAPFPSMIVVFRG